MKTSKHKKPKLVKTVPYAYFLTYPDENVAYRARFTVNTKQKPLGQYTITEVPQMFTPEGWVTSIRYKLAVSEEEEEGCGVSSFTAAIECGNVVRVPMLEACARVDGDVALFAPTKKSSRQVSVIK